MHVHLTQRVAWHDHKWSGQVCSAPSTNSFCLSLDRIRELKSDATEDKLAGASWSKLNPNQLPPCHMEAAGFMSPTPWLRRFEHPYANAAKTSATHGALLPTTLETPAFSAHAVPFRWMLREHQSQFDAQFPDALTADEDDPFDRPSPWVFGRTRQCELLERFFGRLTPQRSLVLYYCKDGHPLGESLSRVVVGVGLVTSVAKLQEYRVQQGQSYPMWDRHVGHSIRPDGSDGFLLPYHEYLAPTGDAEEDARRRALLPEITVAVDAAYTGAFSYGSEHATADIALAVLVRCLEAVRAVRRHGIVAGPWAERETWLDQQIARAWESRGAFPGMGAALHAIGMRLGTALTHELYATGALEPMEDPWPVVDAIIRGERAAPQEAYVADLKAIRSTWEGTGEERRTLVRLLTRFSLSLEQARRIFDPARRAAGFDAPITDAEIIENPYRISELDLGDAEDRPVSVGVIDRGLRPSDPIRQAHPTPAPSAVESPHDPRRLRAVMVSVLRRAAEEGDALLSALDVRTAAALLDLDPRCEIPPDWIGANRAFLDGVIERVEAATDDGSVLGLQLSELGAREAKLQRWLSARATKPIMRPSADWQALIRQALKLGGRAFDPNNPRHADALAEQAEALERIVSRKLTVLTGGAGTGKTTVLGALLLCEELLKEGFLLLAPTGKARVRLGNATKAEANTVAQFLNRLGRYDLRRQRPLFKGAEKYKGAKTVIIDEASMLTLDDLYAVFAALDLAHVQRIILVGDPNQLPPIGVGRPFADLIAWLETATDETGPLSAALGRLEIEVRTAPGSDQASDTLRLASWFTRDTPPVDADRVLSDLQDGIDLNDLEVRYWTTPAELRAALMTALQKTLGLNGPSDVEGFNASLGIEGNIDFFKPTGAERWQILSPVRMHPYGVLDLNRWIQAHFRVAELAKAKQPWGISLGEEMIVARDKVIQTVNQTIKSYDWQAKEEKKTYIANGEIGVMAPMKGKLVGLFADRLGLTFKYSPRQFSENRSPLQLAYALTIHKAQGSEFGVVFVVLPKNTRLLTRELAYTALTRSRQRLVLFVEGSDASALYELSKPERSETARRNTNLFAPAVRAASDSPTPYPEHLIHRTRKGHLVRSKSEFIIANLLYERGLDYEYERLLTGDQRPGRLHPDFSFITDDGEVVLWEHLGMMDRADYRQGWDWKRQWYADNGFEEGRNLFVTTETRASGLDDGVLRNVAEKVEEALG